MAIINILNSLLHQAPNTILAFDTSCDDSSIALWTNGKMYSLSLPLGFGNQSPASLLIPSIQQLLREAAISFQDLDVVSTPTGPGSFTGIRLGIATAHGLLLSTKARSFAPTTFQAIAFGVGLENPILNSLLVTLTTKRNSFYTQAFDKTLMPLSPASIQTEAEIESFLKANPLMNRVECSPTLTATNLIYLYFHLRDKGQTIPDSLEAYYLHNPEFVKRKRCSP